MAVQKSKKSQSKTNSRYANFKAKQPTVVECPQCHEFKVPHKVCKNCGYYDGQEIVSKNEKEQQN
jgi:large subunit ribosomal protein L32